MADGFLISPSGVAYADLEPDMVVKLAWDGQFEGALLPSTEWHLHRQLFLARPELNAIVHTHSPHATAVASLCRDIPAIHYSIAAAGGPSIRCAAYATYGTPALAENVVAAMDARKACLLAHHGVVVAETNLTAALSLAQIVEDLGRYYLLGLPAGQRPVLSDQEIADVIERNRSYGQVSPA
jgi:L-fuculose-phosphate aldolase